MIPGAILAAGRSTRMGRPKALLTLPPGHTRTFVSHIASTLLDGGVSDVLVVGRPDDEPLRDEVRRLRGPVRFVENHTADSGQLSSLIAALNAVDRPGVRGMLVTPVDLPSVKPGTVADLLAAFSRSSRPAAIVRAAHAGKHGHPVIFGRSVFDALRRADPQLGAKDVTRSHPVADVEVHDPGVLHDVDTPEDYARLLALM